MSKDGLQYSSLFVPEAHTAVFHYHIWFGLLRTNRLHSYKHIHRTNKESHFTALASFLFPHALKPTSYLLFANAESLFE